MSKKFLEKASVVSNEQLASCIWKLVLEAPETAKEILPGQFVHLALQQGIAQMLRRPFSVYYANPVSGRIEIIYEVKGKGTTLMTEWPEGFETTLIAPLGNTWMRTLDFEATSALIVGGGVGAAPLYMLTRNLVNNGAKVDVVLGARTAELLVMKQKYENLGANSVTCATDDGTFGVAGFCTVPAIDLLQESKYDYVATCGPVPVMNKVAQAAKLAGVHCEVSMEERMACGLGACKTCVVDTVNGKVKSCECGPIFDAEVISW